MNACTNSSPARRLLLATLAALLLATAAPAQVPKVPATLEIAPKKLGRLAIDANGGKVKFVVVGGPVESFREYDPNPDLVVLRIWSDTPAVAYLVAWSAKDSLPSEAAVCTITIGDKPTPGPTPGPADPLTQKLQAAYAAEVGKAKQVELAYLAATCEGLVGVVGQAQTVGELFARFSKALHAEGLGIPQGALPLVMRALGDYVNGQLGTDPAAALDANKAKATFQALAAALKGVH